MAAAPTRTETLNTFFASTLPKFDRRIYDGVFRGHAVLKMVLDKWGLKSKGGSDIRFPFQYQNDLVVKRMASNSETVDIQDTDPILQAGDDWAYYTVGLQIPDTQIDDNMGEAELFNLQKAKTDMAKNALQEYVEDDVLATSQATNGINSLYASVCPNTATSGTFERVNRATYTAFQPISINAASAAATSVLLNHLRNGFYQASRSQGVDEPDFCVMSMTLYDLWGRFVDSRQFIIGDESDRVPKPMRFWGMEIKWSPNYPDNTSCFGGCSKYLETYISSDSRDNGKWQRPTNARISTRIIHLRAQLMCKEPARFFKIHTLVAS